LYWKTGFYQICEVSKFSFFKVKSFSLWQFLPVTRHSALWCLSFPAPSTAFFLRHPLAGAWTLCIFPLSIVIYNLTRTVRASYSLSVLEISFPLSFLLVCSVSLKLGLDLNFYFLVYLISLKARLDLSL
jgi:hypothetical protein